MENRPFQCLHPFINFVHTLATKWWKDLDEYCRRYISEYISRLTVFQCYDNPNTFSFLASLPPNWGRANKRFPRVSIRGPLAHQAMTRDAKPTCVAGWPKSWCPFIPSLDDVIGLCVFYRSARLAFYGT